jgi:tetratricopeptide (TPR) repeat protein
LVNQADKEFGRLLGTASMPTGESEVICASSLVGTNQISVERKALKEDIDTIVRQAAALQRGGNLSQAVRLYEQVLERQPLNAQILHVAGVACTQLGDFARAVLFLRRALQADPTSDIANSLGLALFPSGQEEEAIACFERALALNPSNAKAANNLGNACLRKRDFECARRAFEAAVRIKFDYIEARSNLGHCLVISGDAEGAIEEFERTLRLSPNYRHAIEGLISAYRVLERYEDIVELRRKLLATEPRNPTLLLEFGISLQEIDRYPEAIDQFRKALEIDPNFAPAHAHIGSAFMEQGLFEQARKSLSSACRLEPDSCSYRLALIGLAKVTREDGTVDWLMKMMQRVSRLPPGEQVLLHFACGKAYADLDNDEKSFEHYLEANRLNRVQAQYDEKRTLANLDRAAQLFSPDVVRAADSAGNRSALPVFILGMPRSGSTLVEQILSGHPNVAAAGELAAFRDSVQRMAVKKGREYPDFLPSLVRDDVSTLGDLYMDRLNRVLSTRLLAGSRSEVLRVTDKMPANFLYLGLIHLALPNARFIHTRRDPIETCLSCFRIHFDTLRYTSDLGELGRYYRRYEALMSAWRSALPPGLILDVDYEHVVENLEREARRIVEHCGLAWNDDCLAFDRVDRPVKTASIAQVRQPLYKTSVKRWRPSEAVLRPLYEGLGLRTIEDNRA